MNRKSPLTMFSMVERPAIFYPPFMQQFIYLPLHTFVHWTNIKEIAEDLFKGRKRTTPTRDEVNQLVIQLYSELHEISWANAGLWKLKFLTKNPNKLTARVFALGTDEQMNIHKNSFDFQKQFLYLPLAVLESATNFEKIVENNRRSLNLTEITTHEMKLKTFLSLCDLSLWEKMQFFELKFIDSKPIFVEVPPSPQPGPSNINRNEETEVVSLPPNVDEQTRKTKQKKETKRNNLDSVEIAVTPQPKRSRREKKSNREEFRQTVEKFSEEEFYSKTNIKELVINDIKKVHAPLTDVAIEKGMKFYYDMVKEKDAWKHSIMKKYLQLLTNVANESEVNHPPPEQSNEPSASELPSNATENATAVEKVALSPIRAPIITSTQISNDGDTVILEESPEDANDQPKIKEEKISAELSYHLGDDSEVFVLEITAENPIVLDSEDIHRDLFGDSMTPNSHPSTEQALTPTGNSSESTNVPETPSSGEQAATPEVDASGSTELSKIPDANQPSESAETINNKRLEQIEAQRTPNESQLREPVHEQLKSTEARRQVAKKHNELVKRTSNEGDLLSIKPPKYQYAPLELVRKKPSDIARAPVFSIPATQPEIEASDDDTSSSRLIIEEFESGDESQDIADPDASAKKNNVSIDVSNLLSEDNTLLINVNTQGMNSNIDGSTKKNNVPEAVASSSTPSNTIQTSIGIPGTSISALRVSFPFNLMTQPAPQQGDKIEYLYHIKMNKFISTKVREGGEDCLVFKLELNYQCNGGSRVTISNLSVKNILNLSENEWKAFLNVLNIMGDVEFDLSINSNTNFLSTLVHRLVHCLIKSIPTFVPTCITFNDHDFESGRILRVPYRANQTDLTAAMNPEILRKMKQQNQINRN